MSSDEAHETDAVRIVEAHDQSVPVPADVEYYAVAAYDARPRVRYVGERSLPATSKYGELEVVSRIKRPTIGGRAVSGPYLFFGVVALTVRRRG